MCGNKPSLDPSASFHRFPKDARRRAGWIRVFGIAEEQLRDHSCVCCRHFPEGDSKKDPLMTIGKRFASPIKGMLPRAKRAKAREATKLEAEQSSPQTPSSSLSSSSVRQHDEGLSEYGEGTDASSSSQMQSRESPSDSTGVLLNTALLARIEYLEAENDRLKASLSKPQYFRIEQVQHDDHLFPFYTGFTSFAILLEFLGPFVHKLNYWGSREKPHQRLYSRKLDPKNQLFLLLVKLRRSLKVEDL